MAKAKQSLTIIKQKGVSLSNANYLIVNRKTGYLNLELNGKKYYYDDRVDTSTITNEVLLVAFQGGPTVAKKKKKGTITVTKK